jgi:cytochrome c-type biogenesis protein CcmH
MLAARKVGGLAVVIVLVTLTLAPAAWACTRPRASLTNIEIDVMCTVCREPLAVAQSAEADQERSYIRGLIAKCMTQAQIEQALVAQYGEAVLGKPPASGINLTVYILPPAILAAGIVALAFTLPRWRRRTRLAAEAERQRQPTPALDPAEAQRLEQELSQFRG